MLQKICWVGPLRLLKCQNDSLQEKLNSEAKEEKKKPYPSLTSTLWWL